METNQPNSTKKKQPTPDSYMRYATMGTQMLIIMALGAFGGYALDQWLHIKFPIFTILLSLVSIAAALYLSVKDFLKK
ncbi:MAG: AtpZ/AtpI family protein [Bacteroidetes bacterium]|nr:AtpZ/AtpI family protein [Bacteroidota bacterium]